MDRFLGLDSQLIKVEVEENTNFHCIVCKAEFISRSERNEHLETHFIHRSCDACSRPVIVIGDLEFELHQPGNCNENKQLHEEVSEERYSIKEQDQFDHNLQCEEEQEIELEEIYQSSPKTKRTRNIVSYTLESSDCENLTKVKINKRPTRKSKRKSTRRNTSTQQIDEEENNYESTLNDEFIKYSKGDTDSEDEVIKEIDVSMKKRRKQYAKLPKTVPCTMCDAMFGTERTLKIHMNQVHGIKERYICPICSREFKIGGNLKQHIETHSDYKRFICNYCGKGFHLPYNLKEHMNTHTGARPYKCETCGKTFGRNTLRQAHMRIHTGEKPYRCTTENCDRAYAYQTDLKRHRRSAHGIITKTFPCPICSKVFYENKFLTKHLNVHQGNV